jgi:hypothetical protein
MKNSIVYKMESKGDNQSIIRKLTLLLTRTNSMGDERFRQGIIPFPRDGHTANLYNDVMIIFGGDRNKFPFNDLFTFSFK